MKAALLAFLPVEALPVLIALAGLGVMVGVVRPRSAFGFIAAFVAVLALTPFLEQIFMSMPFWIVVIATAAIVLSLARVLLTAMLGKEGAGHVLGSAFVGFVKLLGWAVTVPFRIVGALLRGAGGAR